MFTLKAKRAKVSNSEFYTQLHCNLHTYNYGASWVQNSTNYLLSVFQTLTCSYICT